MGRACRNSVRSAADRFNKIMKHTVCKVVTVVFALLPVFGLFGCGGGKKYTSDDVVLINTAYYGTEMNPVYSFALKKEKTAGYSLQTVLWEVRRIITPRSARSR